MTETPAPAEDAWEAETVGERSDLGRTRDALADSLTGTDSGSDTRAGSLEGGSASGSDEASDQDLINETLASEGMASADPQSPADVGPDAIKNTGAEPGSPGEDPAEGKRDADAATG